MRGDAVPVRLLKAGDLVRHYGMTLRVEHEPKRSASHPDTFGGCYYAEATVQNPDELREADAWLWNMARGETTHMVRNARLPEDDGLARWALQGNDLGTYHRIPEEG